jgi:hypothetical protein
MYKDEFQAGRELTAAAGRIFGKAEQRQSARIRQHL